METSTLAIKASKLTKQFGTRRAVASLSFELPQGAFLSIFGPNGAGKTTLLRMLATLSKPTSGTCKIQGFDLKTQAAEARANIELVAHGSMLYPDLSALENLTFYGQMYGLENPETRAREVLEMVGMDHRRFDVVRSFSRGMTQRVSIARALMPDPKLILLDEPYSGLDPHAMATLDELIAHMRDGRTFVMVSHDLDKGLELASHMLLLEKGKKVIFTNRAEMTSQEQELLRATITGSGVAK